MELEVPNRFATTKHQNEKSKVSIRARRGTIQQLIINSVIVVLGTLLSGVKQFVSSKL
jgi:hypothetical protein